MTKKNMLLAIFMALTSPLAATPIEGKNFNTNVNSVQNEGYSTVQNPSLVEKAKVVAVGPTGPRGPIGRQGPQGDTGPRGVDGNNGHDGADGRDGRDGLDGVDGIDGVNGAQGEHGPRGRRGLEGPASLAGETGPTGPQGVEGPIGSMGPQGADGSPGLMGPQGLQGPTGSVGPTGAAGETGPTSVASFGDFYAQTTFDNPNPILPGETIKFSSLGHNSGGVIVDPFSNSDTFILPVPGAYMVLFQANVAESGAQLVLTLDRGCGFDEISASRVSSNNGPTQLVGMYIVRTRGYDERIQVRNAETSSTPITLTVNSGSPFSAHVLITQLQ